MSDPLRKVRPGDELKIPASAYNAFVDATRAHRDGTATPAESNRRRSAGIVPIRNDSGSDLARYSVLGLDGPIVEPSDDEAGFLRGVSFRGVIPEVSHARKFAILMDPIPADQVGPGLVSGVTQARINISDEGHTCAVAAMGDTDALASAPIGPAQILWREGGTGEQWAIVRRSTACGSESDDIPDDGTGCCEQLPAADLPGSLAVTTYDRFGLVIGEATIEGPFRYNTDGFIYQRPFEEGYWSAVHYYRADGVCVLRRENFCGIIDGNQACVDDLYKQRITAVLACAHFTPFIGAVYHPDIISDLATPRVRLFITSNFGQVNPTSEGEPANCDNQPCDPEFEGSGVGDCGDSGPLDPFWWLTAVKRWWGIFGTGTANDPYVDPGVYIDNCHPEHLCYAVDVMAAAGFSTGRIVGSIGYDECEVPDGEPIGCVTFVALNIYCDEDACPEDQGELYAVEARREGSVYGRGIVRWREGEEGDCLSATVLIPVRIPIDPMTSEPYSPFPLDLFRIEVRGGEPTVTFIRSVEIVDCEPLIIDEGIPPEMLPLQFRLMGCPDHLPLPGVLVTVAIYSDDGETLHDSRVVLTTEAGYGYALLSLPGPAGDYRVVLTPAATYPGYKTDDVVFEDVALPEAGTECFSLDLGDVVAPIADDHVCTCGGAMPKCVSWDGIGAATEAHYNDGTGEWEGEETANIGTDAGLGSFCGFGSTDNPDPTFPVTLAIETDGEDCVAVATRSSPYCLQFTGGDCPDGITRLLARYEDEFVEVRAGTKARLVLTPWGPTGAFPGFTLGGAFPWTLPDGSPDPDNCLAPAEGFTTAVVGDCGGGGMMMMAIAPPDGGDGGPSPDRSPPPGPPLPSPLRMAGELARTAGRVVRRAVKGGGVRASADEQAKRWSICRACDHYRASDRRCGKVNGCGCHLSRAIPLAAKACPIGRWGPEAEKGSPGPVSR